ncbi:aminoglycoside phosphotransferase family protein, partial [Streptomyces sp. NPDC001980]
MEITPDDEAPLPDPWPVRFVDRGHTDVRRIGSGVEGVVYSLGEDRVAKVWSGRPPAGFRLTRQVYADIARHPLPFSTPEIFDAEEYEGVLVTYERKLPGVPLRADSAQVDYERELPTQHNDALLAVLRGLASVPGTDAMRQMTVKGDDRPLWRDHDRFQDALAALVARAATR